MWQFIWPDRCIFDQVGGQTEGYLARYMGIQMNMCQGIWAYRWICDQVDRQTEGYVGR